MDNLNTPAKFEVRSFASSWDNRGYSINLGRPWIHPRSPFSQIFKGLLFGWTLWIYLPNLKFVALHIPEIIGGTQKNLGCPWIRPRSLFSNIFHGLVFGWTLRIYLWSSWDNSDCSFGVELRTPNLREGEAIGVGDGTVRKSVCDFL